MTWTIPDQGEASNDLQSELFQSSLDALAAGPSLTGVMSGCAVTAQSTPDMTVAVAAGLVSMVGAQVTVAAGNVTIGAADGTNPRLDLVVANASGVKSVLAGTAAAAPKEPTLDTTTYVLLAQVYIPAAATTITTARITDRRVVVHTGVAGLGVYGDGSDGSVTFDGTTTVLGLAPSSNVYVLTRDLFLAGGTINSGVVINCAGFRLFCAGTLTNNGTISWNPVAASGSSGAGALQKSTSSINTVTTLGAAGGSGGTVAGSAGSNQTSFAYGGNGSAGGAGSSGAGGAAGTLTNPLGSGLTKARFTQTAIMPWIPNAGSGAVGNMYVPSGGAGGGGGGGDGTRSGGGGGCGGGIVVVVVYKFAGTGAINCRGGAAGNGTAAGNCGGGGGGGGGMLVVISSSVSNGAIPGQTCDANGGAGGTATGTGVAGSTGGAGTVILLPN